MAAVIWALGAPGAEAGSVTFTSTRCDAGEPPRFPARPGLCHQRLWRVDEDGSRLQRLTSDPTNESYVADPAWSPDGSQIAFVKGGGYVGEGLGAQLWLMNADGSNQRPLTPGTKPPPTRFAPGGTVAEQGPIWSPDGKFLVFSIFDSVVANDLAVVAADGSGYRRLTDTSEFESEPSFSPDGLSIMFTFRGDLGPKPPGEARESSGIYSLSLVDGRTRRVTLGPSQQFSARYSPDGRRISYVEDGAIWTMTADGRDKTRRTGPVFGTDPVQPAWSGPNSLIFGGRGAEPRSLQQLDVSRPGTAPAPLAIGAPEPPASDQSPAWHPGTPILPLPPLPDRVPPELGLVDVGAVPGARTAARARPPAAASRRSLRYTGFDRSGISRLQASVERTRGKRCRYLTRKGLGKRRSCRKPAYFGVRRRADWTSRLGRLAPGTYRIRLRAWDARGNHVKRPRAKTIRIRR